MKKETKIVKEIKSHKDLEVYKEAMNLVEVIYRLTKELPSEEKFGLISQMRRAAVSIVSNIAEGAARKNTKEYIQFLYISLGSLSELETQIDVCNRLGYYEKDVSLNKKVSYINSMLSGLIASLKRKL